LTRAPDPVLILIFRGTHQVLSAEKRLKRGGVPLRLIPVRVASLPIAGSRSGSPSISGTAPGRSFRERGCSPCPPISPRGRGVRPDVSLRIAGRDDFFSSFGR